MEGPPKTGRKLKERQGRLRASYGLIPPWLAKSSATKWCWTYGPEASETGAAIVAPVCSDCHKKGITKGITEAKKQNKGSRRS